MVFLFYRIFEKVHSLSDKLWVFIKRIRMHFLWKNMFVITVVVFGLLTDFSKSQCSHTDPCDFTGTSLIHKQNLFNIS